MLTVEFNGDVGITLPDNKVVSYVAGCIDNYKQFGFPDRVIVGNHLIVNEFRVQVLDSNIVYTDLQFEFNGRVLPVNEFGRIQEWPHGFCDVLDNQLHHLILGAGRKKRATQTLKTEP